MTLPMPLGLGLDARMTTKLGEKGWVFFSVKVLLIMTKGLLLLVSFVQLQ